MTGRGRRQRDEEWTRKFSKLLRLVVESNNINLDHLDSDAGILMGTYRTWVTGRNLPVPSYFMLLLSASILGKRVPTKSNTTAAVFPEGLAALSAVKGNGCAFLPMRQ